MSTLFKLAIWIIVFQALGLGSGLFVYFLDRHLNPSHHSHPEKFSLACYVSKQAAARMVLSVLVFIAFFASAYMTWWHISQEFKDRLVTLEGIAASRYYPPDMSLYEYEVEREVVP